MAEDPIIRAVLEEYEDFTLLDDEPEQADPFIHYCRDSKKLWRYIDEVLNLYVRNTTNLIRLTQARVLITDRYFEDRAWTPQAHRDKLGGKGHICLYQVWIAGMDEIFARKRDLDPPKVVRIVTPKAKEDSGSYSKMAPAIFLGNWE